MYYTKYYVLPCHIMILIFTCVLEQLYIYLKICLAFYLYNIYTKLHAKKVFMHRCPENTDIICEIE